MEVKVISGSGENGEQAESHPEVWLAVQGFLVAFLWEMLQMPFYVMDGMTAWAVTKSCALASLGDAGIMVGAAWIADRLTGGGLWHERLSSPPVGIFLGVGLAATAAIEWKALGLELFPINADTVRHWGSASRHVGSRPTGFAGLGETNGLNTH